jgi:hypothetical protein
MAVFAALLSLLELVSGRRLFSQNIERIRTRQKPFGSHGIAELVSGDRRGIPANGEADRAFDWVYSWKRMARAPRSSRVDDTVINVFDFKSEFRRHIAPRRRLSQILAYASLRLGYLESRDAGIPKAALRTFKRPPQIPPPSAV